MSERKYRLTDETITVFGRTLYRIQATENIPSRYVDEGDLGGFIEKESNLSGDAWVSGNAWVFGNAEVSGNAEVFQKQHIFVAGPAGVESRWVTVAHTGTDEIFVRIGCWEGTLTTMMQAVAERRDKHWGRHDEATQERWQAEYQAIHDMIAIRAESWKPEKENNNGTAQ
nr:MAG TPA: Putative transferase, nesg, ydcK, Structural Genomics.38A [Caudoviricetes sp.]